MLRRASTLLVIPLVVAIAAAGLWLGLLQLRVMGEGDRFDFVRWEAQALPNRLLWVLGRPLRDDPGDEDALVRYFALTDRTGAEARRLENAAEATIERRVAEVLRDQGIGWPFPGGMPPVDMELASSPRILVTSPRSRIERIEAEPLRPDLGRAEAQAIEAAEERAPDRSALVVPSGGIATYPAIVVAGDSYRDTVSTTAHEWTHHYLALYPLGRAYFATDEARTINETVADIVGDEVTRLVVERWGVPEVPGAPRAAEPTSTAAPPRPNVDVTKALRDLRIEVDALLAGGRVEEAERRMQEVRDDLGRHGVNIRRINQAYFAWYGTYAARPESADPLGGQLRGLLQRAGSLRAFVAAVREVQTRSGVQHLADAGRQER